MYVYKCYKDRFLLGTITLVIDITTITILIPFAKSNSIIFKVTGIHSHPS